MSKARSKAAENKRLADVAMQRMRDRAAAQRAEEEAAARLLAEEIDALPPRVRRYIADLKTNFDPAGDKWRILALEETVAGLEDEVKRLTSAEGRQPSNNDDTKGESR
jgi:hypothetical protein